MPETDFEAEILENEIAVELQATGQMEAARPDLVSGLVVIQAPSWSEEQRWARRIDPGGVVGFPGAGQILNALLARRLARTWYAAALPGRGQFDHFAAPATAALGDGACFCLASLIQANRPTAG